MRQEEVKDQKFKFHSRIKIRMLSERKSLENSSHRVVINFPERRLAKENSERRRRIFSLVEANIEKRKSLRGNWASQSASCAYKNVCDVSLWSRKWFLDWNVTNVGGSRHRMLIKMSIRAIRMLLHRQLDWLICNEIKFVVADTLIDTWKALSTSNESISTFPAETLD